MSTTPNDPQHGGYGIPNQPSNQPQNPAPQPGNGGYGVPNQPPAPGNQPYGSYGTPHAPQTPPTAPNQGPSQNGAFPAPVKPLVVETSYAWLYFFGTVGAHKFYMRQSMQGIAYAGVFLAVLILNVIPIIGGLISFVGFIALYLSLYADIRTMREQVERSNAGQTFAIPQQLEFVKKAFNK